MDDIEEVVAAIREDLDDEPEDDDAGEVVKLRMAINRLALVIAFTASDDK